VSPQFWILLRSKHMAHKSLKTLLLFGSTLLPLRKTACTFHENNCINLLPSLFLKNSNSNWFQWTTVSSGIYSGNTITTGVFSGDLGNNVFTETHPYWTRSEGSCQTKYYFCFQKYNSSNWVRTPICYLLLSENQQ